MNILCQMLLESMDIDILNELNDNLAPLRIDKKPGHEGQISQMCEE